MTGSTKRFSLSAPVTVYDDAARTMEQVVNLLLSRFLLNPKGDDVTEALYSIVLQLLEERLRFAVRDAVIDKLIRTIAASFADPEFRITDALLSTGYSKDHIRRRFTEATGLSPAAYLRRIRIGYAKNMLQEKDRLHLSVSDIAERSGYDDPAYFCRIFHREVGVPPSEYPVRTAH